MTKVITYQADNGSTINLTPTQEDRLTEAGVWPKTPSGREFCRVSHGLHEGSPSYSDDQIDQIIRS